MGACMSTNPKEEKSTEREKPREQPKTQKVVQINQESKPEEPEIDINIDSVIIQE